MQWGLPSEVNRYASKLEGLLLLPFDCDHRLLRDLLSSGSELAPMAVVRAAVVISTAAVYSAMLFVYRGRNVNMTKSTLSVVVALVVAMIVTFRVSSRASTSPDHCLHVESERSGEALGFPAR